MTGVTYPGNFAIIYVYDQYDRIVRIPGFVEQKVTIDPTSPDPSDNPITDPDPINTINTISSFGVNSITITLPGVEYKANGFMTVLRYANGITTTYTDDSLGRLQTIKNSACEFTYSYDGTGNITAITGQNGANFAATYVYNALGWLKSAQQDQDTYAYDYDAAGNCVRKTINGIQTTYTYNPAELNLLTGINGTTVDYDVWGNMVARENSQSYTYDSVNQLTKVTKNSQDVGSYFYNSEGKRYKKVENGLSTYAIYGGERLLCEVKSDGTYVYYIYLNGAQVAKVERKNGVDTKYFYHTDNLGSTRAITDAEGNVVGRVSYQPFGLEQANGQEVSTLTYTDKMQDDSTGLYYFNARYYDPTLGRFVTEDPTKDGSNWYIYCINSPLIMKDVTGRTGEISIGWYESMWWLCLSDGIFPIGDVVYGAGGALLYLGEYGVAFIDKLPGLVDYATNTTDKIPSNTSNSHGNGSMNPNDFDRFKKIKPEQWHHIIPQKFRDHPLLKEASKMGIDFIKESWNKIYVPHQGGHTQEYYKFVEKKLNEAYQAYVRCNMWTEEGMRDMLKSISDTVLDELINSNLHMYK